MPPEIRFQHIVENSDTQVQLCRDQVYTTGNGIAEDIHTYDTYIPLSAARNTIVWNFKTRYCKYALDNRVLYELSRHIAACFRKSAECMKTLERQRVACCLTLHRVSSFQNYLQIESVYAEPSWAGVREFESERMERMFP